MKLKNIIFIIFLVLIGCSHELTIKNLHLYSVPMKFTKVGGMKPSVAVLPFSGKPDDMFYYNAIIGRMGMSSAFGEFYTDYIPMRENATSKKPDIVLTITPLSDYQSSGWNFLINWPGFLIFTPAWNGYIYHANIMTVVDIKNAEGSTINQLQVPMSFDIRQAEFDRTVFTGITWLEVSALAFGGGFYNALVFDRDIIGQLQFHIKDSYSNYVVNELESRILSSCRSI